MPKNGEEITFVAYPVVLYRPSTAPVAVLPTPSVMCFTGLPTPAGALSRPFPATPVTPLIVLFNPVVALSVTVLTAPVVSPTPLFTPPVTAFDAVPIAPGFFWAAAGVLFFTAVGVGFVPSGLTVDFTGVFLTGVAFDALVTVLEVVLVGVVFVAFSFGPELTEFLTLGPLTAGTGADDAGVVFFAAIGVFAAGLDASLTILLADTGVFLVGVAPEVVDVGGTGFLAAAGVALRGVLFAELVVFCDVAAAVLLSFAGAFLTGAVEVPVVFVAAGVVFFTGVVVFCVVEAAVLVGGFAVVEPPCATFCRFATPAVDMSITSRLPRKSGG